MCSVHPSRLRCAQARNFLVNREEVALKKIIVRKDAYYDSVFLMLASKAIKKTAGIIEAVVSMGTITNVNLIKAIGFDIHAFQDVRPNDLIIAIEAESEETLADAIKAVDDFLSKQGQAGGRQEAYRPVSLRNAMRFEPQSNLVLISVPGPYAAREARQALADDKHVMIFSDNVPIEEEIELKKCLIYVIISIR